MDLSINIIKKQHYETLSKLIKKLLRPIKIKYNLIQKKLIKGQSNLFLPFWIRITFVLSTCFINAIKNIKAHLKGN